MLKVGLTGGIGSGKSVVGKIFQLLDIPIYVADIEAKKIMHSNKTVQQQLITTFGKEVYTSENTINKAYLASVIFNRPDALEQINAIVHPAVRSDFQQWCLLQKNAPYIIQESAILFDTGIYRQFDKTITVTANEKLRIQRVMQRDNITEKQVAERIKNQLSEEQRINKADFIVYNNTEMLIPQILKIHQTILESL